MELYIENTFIDVNESFSTLLTFAIDDIRDFGAKSTTFSKTIILPGTKHNNAFFGNVFEVTASNDYDLAKPNQGINFNAAVSAKAYMFCDNIQTFKGVVRLMEVIVDNGAIEYEVAVFGELGGFASMMGNNKLQDLDFSGYSHAYTAANITASWANAGTGQGYYYPLMDYGNYSTLKKNWKYKTFRPALFAKEYIDKIFEKAGYTYDCQLFNTSRFKSLIVPQNQKVLQKVSSSYLNVLNTVDTISSGAAAYTVPYPTQATLGAFTYSAGVFTLTGTSITGTVEIKMGLDIDKEVGQQVYIDLYKNGVSIASRFIPSSAYYVIEPFIVPNVTLAAGDTIKVVILGKNGDGSNFTVDVRYSTLTISPSDKVETLVPVSLGEIFGINASIPQNILQKDFISSIIKLFNLYVFEDPDNEKRLKIMPFVDFFAGVKDEDWSLKLDRGKPIRVKPMSEINARYYDFKFKDDSDYYNDLYKKRYSLTYGSLIYDSNYEFAKETETIELIFSGTPLVGYTGEDKVYSTIFKRTGEALGVGEENTDSNIRLLQAKKITGVSSWDILADDGTTVLTSQTEYGYAGHLNDPNAPANDIHFGVPKELFFTLATGALNVNQFNVYWSSYMAEITDKDSRLLTGTFKLNFKDIYNLDFSKLIYLDGSLYRLNKITDFNATAEDTCQVELLKLMNKIY